MKKIISAAAAIRDDRDGFLNGFIKGSLGAGTFLSIILLFTACFGG